MNPLATAVLAFSMSADAFAATLAKGAALDRPKLAEALRTGLLFGLVEATTPVIGWVCGRAASGFIDAIDHWIAFTLLALLGARMLWQSVRRSAAQEKPRRHPLGVLLATAVGTSLDALAVGVTLAFIDADILVAALAIGLATFTMGTLGILLGRIAGGKFGRVAEALGGIGLIAIGTKILIEHTLLS